MPRPFQRTLVALATLGAVIAACLGFTTGTASAASGRNVPIGWYDTLGYTDAVSGFRVTGWCYDADRPDLPCDVHIKVDGGRPIGLNAGEPRPDVAASLRLPMTAPYINHGFRGDYPYSTPGPHSVCIYAIDLLGPGANPSLGCKTIIFPGLMNGVYYFTRDQTAVVAGGGVAGAATLATLLMAASGGILLPVVIATAGGALSVLSAVVANQGVCLWVNTSSGAAGAYSCRKGWSV